MFWCYILLTDQISLSDYLPLIFFIFNTHYLRNLHQAIASSIYNVETSRKILLCIFDFKMSVVRCS